MKNILYIIPILGVLTCAFSCKETPPPPPIEINSPQPSELYDKYKNSVVMVENEYYYTFEADKGTTYYYSPGSDFPFYTTYEDLDSIISKGTGTGFFISKSGKIITNRHVVHPDPDDFINDFKIFKTYIDITLAAKIRLYNDTLQTIQNIITRIDSLEDIYPISLPSDIILTMQRKLSVKFSNNNLLFNSAKGLLQDILLDEHNKIYSFKQEINTVLSAYEDLFNSNPILLQPKYKNHKLKIQYNESYSNPDDFQDCRIIQVSQDPDVDLALINTIDQPKKNYNLTLFDFTEHNANVLDNSASDIKAYLKNPVSINDEVFIIGFNDGGGIGRTMNGLQAQFTSGNISQRPSDNRLLYTIPVLPGSSGSPVIDKWGNLVAVNFAGMRNTQSFNYGIPVYKLYEFLNGKLVN